MDELAISLRSLAGLFLEHVVLAEGHPTDWCNKRVRDLSNKLFSSGVCRLGDQQALCSAESGGPGLRGSSEYRRIRFQNYYETTRLTEDFLQDEWRLRAA